eukprot:11182622-Lingulodinium_polyedra.AAC.1
MAGEVVFSAPVSGGPSAAIDDLVRNDQEQLRPAVPQELLACHGMGGRARAPSLSKKPVSNWELRHGSER